MTDRDRLKELLKQANTLYLDYLENIDQKGLIDTEGRAKFFADYLIANGVIVPPCAVGDYVYCIFENKVRLASVLSFYINKVGIIVDLKISLNGKLPTAPSAVCHIDRDS